jgi:hypothetical protein
MFLLENILRNNFYFWILVGGEGCHTHVLPFYLYFSHAVALNVGADIMFISGGHPHLTSWFCKVELGPTTNSKMIRAYPRSIGSLAIRFPLFDQSGHALKVQPWA